jgi:hypothetical protein
MDPMRMLAKIEEFGAHVVVVFRPETVPPGLFRSLDALTLGWNTEPLPRPGEPVHPDLAWRLSELQGLDPANFDRVVTFDPLSRASAEALVPIWRCVPLPVDDVVYASPRPLGSPPRVAFVGYSTEHRERWLIDSKHRFDLLHAAHGIHGSRLLDLFARTDVAINLHGEPYPTFENRVSLHLAAGHLLLSEPLSPLHGLEPDIDFIEVRGPKLLEWTIEGLHRHAGEITAVQTRGRMKAEQFRASRVYPRLIADLLDDVAAFGRGRTPGRAVVRAPQAALVAPRRRVRRGGLVGRARRSLRGTARRLRSAR